MRKHFNSFLALVSILLLGLGSCGTASIADNPSSSSSGELSEYVGGEDWDSSWDDPWGSESVPSEGGACDCICSVCGKCLDPDCTEHTEKCYDLNGRTKQDFYAIDDKVSRIGGSMGDVSVVSDADGGYVGNFSLNIGANISYSITSPKANRACIGINVSKKGSEDIHPFSLLTCKVNGAEFFSRGILHKAVSGSDWFEFGDSYGGCVDLKAGKNTFTFTPNEDVTSFNFRDMFLISSETLTLDAYDEGSSHTCTSQNADGKCTDYDCNLLPCLDKDETGWTEKKLKAGDSKLVALREDGTTNMYNPVEDVIGEVNNYTGQKIAFSFSSTDDCYARVSLEHSGCGIVTFASMFHMFINGMAFITEGRTGGEPQDWFTYYTSTVGYIHLQKGDNTFQFNHDIITSGFNIKSIILCYQSGACDFIQAALA